MVHVDLALKFEAVNSITRQNKPSSNYANNTIKTINKCYARSSSFKSTRNVKRINKLTEIFSPVYPRKIPFVVFLATLDLLYL